MSKAKAKNSVKNNIFDLSQLVPKQKDVEVKSNKDGKSTNSNEDKPVYVKTTEANISEKGYVLVPEDQWGNIPVQSYIRYMKRNGEITKGGFIESIFPNINKNGEAGFSIHLKTTFGKTFRWILHTSTVEKIWVKLDSEENAIQQVLAQHSIVTPVPLTTQFIPATKPSNIPANGGLQSFVQQLSPQQLTAQIAETKCCEFDKIEIEIMKDDITVCKKTIESLKKELQRVQSENVRIVTFLKKLNERK